MRTAAASANGSINPTTPPSPLKCDCIQPQNGAPAHMMTNHTYLLTTYSTCRLTQRHVIMQFHFLCSISFIIGPAQSRTQELRLLHRTLSFTWRISNLVQIRHRCQSTQLSMSHTKNEQLSSKKSMAVNLTFDSHEYCCIGRRCSAQSDTRVLHVVIQGDVLNYQCCILKSAVILERCSVIAYDGSGIFAVPHDGGCRPTPGVARQFECVSLDQVF